MKKFRTRAPNASLPKKSRLYYIMSYLNGRLLSEEVTISSQRGLPGVGFKLTADGNYDIENNKTNKCQESDR